MYPDLSQRQTDILEYIKRVIREKGYPPSVREIGDAVGLMSSSTVHGHLQTIEEKGYIRRDPTKPRAIEILDSSSDANEKRTVFVPIIGKVTAGQPILAQENIEDTFPLPIDLVNSDTVFMLKVKGESMIDAGIMDGDLILVRQQKVARNGEIVVAMIGDEEATVKRFYKEKTLIRLQPENPYMEPIYSQDVTILGKVIGVFRIFH